MKLKKKVVTATSVIVLMVVVKVFSNVESKPQESNLETAGNLTTQFEVIESKVEQIEINELEISESENNGLESNESESNKSESNKSESNKSESNESESNESESNESESNELEKVKLDRVVDGDTLVVVSENNISYKIRLIGVDTPESVHPKREKNNEYGVLASEYTKEIVEDVEYLYLEYDEDETDRYDRILAYVWLVDKVDEEKVDTDMLNGVLLYNGYGIDKEYKPNVAYSDEFQALSEYAEDNGSGLWQYKEVKELWK